MALVSNLLGSMRVSYEPLRIKTNLKLADFGQFRTILEKYCIYSRSLIMKVNLQNGLT